VGAIAREARTLGIRSSVGCPIVVAGRLWGAIAASTKGDVRFPADTESQIARFTELVATAVQNAEARAELMASRARIAAASDQTRRSIERDLHDGVQQRLVSLTLQLRTAQATLPHALDGLHGELDSIAAGLLDAIDELRELASGIHPAILAEGGLVPALKALARRSRIPVDLNVHVGRLPEQIEVNAYYVVSEALTNVAKHAHASTVDVTVKIASEVLHVAVRDDGIGGVDFTGGTGLLGLKDRVEALEGRIHVESLRGAGTVLYAELPLSGTGRITSS
jgi:signal transduction histidine kinase